MDRLDQLRFVGSEILESYQAIVLAEELRDILRDISFVEAVVGRLQGLGARLTLLEGLLFGLGNPPEGAREVGILEHLACGGRFAAWQKNPGTRCELLESPPAAFDVTHHLLV